MCAKKNKKTSRLIHKHRFRKRTSTKGLPPGSLVYTGDRVNPEMFIHSIWFNQNEFKDAETYKHDWAPETPGIFWIDVRSLHIAESIQTIGKDFKIHPLVLEDILDTQQRAKLEEYENGLFIVLYNLHLGTEQIALKTEQISLFLGPNFVLSFQEDPDDTFAPVRERARTGAPRLRLRKADYLAYAILDLLTDNYFTLIDELEKRIHLIEDELYTEGATQHCKNQIHQTKRIVFSTRQYLLPLKDATYRLYKDSGGFVEEINKPFYRDVVDHVSQMIDILDNYRDLLNGAESLFQAEAANKLNNVMRLLTVISTIFIPLSFITGLYGMNFDHMPELHNPNGYYYVIAFMLTLSLGMLWYFRKNRWI